tara:strand:- start:2783 stop:2998 length:216 start_codon:yes stop_codon:yes gene_type:complete
MKITKKGDLVYVPSHVTLYTSDTDGAIQKIMKLSKPTNLLVTGEISNSYEILYEGEKWLVNKNMTYEVKND